MKNIEMNVNVDKATVLNQILMFKLILEWPDYNYMYNLIKYEEKNVKQLIKEYYSLLPLFKNAIEKLKYLIVPDKLGELTIEDMKTIFNKRRADLKHLKILQSND